MFSVSQSSPFVMVRTDEICLRIMLLVGTFLVMTKQAAGMILDNRQYVTSRKMIGEIM